MLNVLHKIARCSRHLEAVGQYFTENGVKVDAFRVRWSTPYFNKLIRRIANIWWAPLRLWFRIGVWSGLVIMILSVVLLTWTIVDFVSRSGSGASDWALFAMLQGGIVSPSSHLSYYFLALMITGIIHEGGHAVAAEMYV